MLSIYAGITTYNPNIDRLKENICAVIHQVQGLIIVDNGSHNLEEIKSLCKAFDDECRQDCLNIKIKLVENNKNKGVAHALNQIMSSAIKFGRADWVLTLDQDTVVYDNIIQMYKDFITGRYYDYSMASLTCLRHDRNYEEKNKNGYALENTGKSFDLVKSCITSGNMISSDAWYKIRGFDGRLFVDMVDDEICYRLRENGYKIVRINHYGYLHELGENIHQVKILGRTRRVFEYSPMRKFYTARNTVYMTRRYKLGLVNEYYSYLIKRMLGTLLYEKKKLSGLKAYIKGIKSGKKLDCIK